MGLEYFFNKTGPMTMPPSQLGAFAKSDSSQASANIEWHVQPLSLDAFGSPLHKYDAITPSVCNLRPSSRGSISITSTDPATAPAIRPNYLSTEEDLNIAVAGLKFTRKIMAAPALQPFNPQRAETRRAFNLGRGIGFSRRRFRHHYLSSSRHLQNG